jgi:hypothetical protein
MSVKTWKLEIKKEMKYIGGFLVTKLITSDDSYINFSDTFPYPYKEGNWNMFSPNSQQQIAYFEG